MEVICVYVLRIDGYLYHEMCVYKTKHLYQLAEVFHHSQRAKKENNFSMHFQCLSVRFLQMCEFSLNAKCSSGGRRDVQQQEEGGNGWNAYGQWKM